jgi:hypothetical protein
MNPNVQYVVIVYVGCGGARSEGGAYRPPFRQASGALRAPAAVQQDRRYA